MRKELAAIRRLDQRAGMATPASKAGERPGAAMPVRANAGPAPVAEARATTPARHLSEGEVVQASPERLSATSGTDVNIAAASMAGDASGGPSGDRRGRELGALYASVAGAPAPPPAVAQPLAAPVPHAVPKRATATPQQPAARPIAHGPTPSPAPGIVEPDASAAKPIRPGGTSGIASDPGPDNRTERFSPQEAARMDADQFWAYLQARGGGSAVDRPHGRDAAAQSPRGAPLVRPLMPPAAAAPGLQSAASVNRDTVAAKPEPEPPGSLPSPDPVTEHSVPDGDASDDAWRRKLIQALQEIDDGRGAAAVSPEVASAFMEPRVALVVPMSEEGGPPPRLLTEASVMAPASEAPAGEAGPAPDAGRVSSAARAQVAEAARPRGRVARMVTRAALVPHVPPRARRAGVWLTALIAIAALVPSSGLKSAIPADPLPPLAATPSGLTGLRQLGRLPLQDPGMLASQSVERPSSAPVLVRDGQQQRPPLPAPAAKAQPAAVASTGDRPRQVLGAPQAPAASQPPGPAASPRRVDPEVPSGPPLVATGPARPATVTNADRNRLNQLVASLASPPAAALPAPPSTGVRPLPTAARMSLPQRQQQTPTPTGDVTPVSPRSPANPAVPADPRRDPASNAPNPPAGASRVAEAPAAGPAPASPPPTWSAPRQGLQNPGTSTGFMSYLRAMVQPTPQIWNDPRLATP